MEQINFEAINEVLWEWYKLPAENFATSLMVGDIGDKYSKLVQLRGEALSMVHLLALIKREIPEAYKILEGLMMRDYILRIKEFYVSIVPFHLFEAHLEVLADAGIEARNPITSPDQLRETICKILDLTTLNVQMVWSQPGRSGTLFIDDKNFKQR